MIANKQLVVVVEGTVETGYYWPAIVTNYLEKIIKEFSSEEVQQSSNTNEGKCSSEVSVVVFNSLGSYAPVFQRVPWTQRIDEIMSSLSTLKFSEGGVDDAPVGDGLADALRLFEIPQNGCDTDGNLDGKRHCILVASGNPYPYDRWNLRPNIDGCGHNYSCFSDETVARWFAQCSVSLSVICPRNIPKIRTLYEVAKRNPNAEDPLVQVHQPGYLVLISENFKEALTALGATIPAPWHKALSPISSAPCQNALTPTGPTLDQKALDPTNTAPYQIALDPSSPKPHQNGLLPTSPATNQDLDPSHPTSPAPYQYVLSQTNQVPNQDALDPTKLAPSQDALNAPSAQPSQDALNSSGPAPPQEAVTPLHPEFEASTSNQPEYIPTSKTLHESVGDISTQRLYNEPMSVTSWTESCLEPHTLSFLNVDTPRILSLQTLSLAAVPVDQFCDIEDIQWPDHDVVESMLDTIFKHDICFSESPEITSTAVPDFASGSMGPGSGTVTATSQFVKNPNESFMVSALIEDQIPVTSELQPSSLLLDTIFSMELAPDSQIEDILGANRQNNELNKSRVVKNANECPRSGLASGTCPGSGTVTATSQFVMNPNESFMVSALIEDQIPITSELQPFSLLLDTISSMELAPASQIEDILGANRQNNELNKSWVVKNANECPMSGLASGMCPGSGTITATSQFVMNPNESFMVSALIEDQIPIPSELQPSSLLLDTISSMELAPASQIEDILGAKRQNTELNKSRVVKNANECPRSGLATGTCPGSGMVTATSQFVKNPNESFMVSALIGDQIPITSELQPSSLLLDTISSMELAPASQIEDILGAKRQNTELNKSRVVKYSNECPRSGLATGTCRSVEKLNEYSGGATFTKGKFQVAAQHHPFGIPQSPYSILGQPTSSHKDNWRANLDKTLLNMPPRFADDLIRSSFNPRFRTTTSASKLIKKRNQRLKATTSIKGNIPSTIQKQFSSHLPETTPSILGQLTSHEDYLGVNLASSPLNIPPKSQVYLACSSSSMNLDETLPKIPPMFKVVEQQNGSSYFAPSAKITVSQKVSSPLANTKYENLWEGDLCCQPCGKAVLIGRVKAFKMASSSVMLAKDWPKSITVVSLRALEKLNEEFDVSRAVLVVFKALTSHPFLNHLKKKGLGAKVDLPSQTLILSASNEDTRLIGWLFPKVLNPERISERFRY